ncbi:MAG: hypothetical protein ACJ8C4_02775 [Gemmataceae bacterium]
MLTAPLSIDEVVAAVRACAHIRIPDRPPEYLREFLACRLRPRDPALANKIESFDSMEFHEFLQLVHDFQDAGRID